MLKTSPPAHQTINMDINKQLLYMYSKTCLKRTLY